VKHRQAGWRSRSTCLEASHEWERLSVCLGGCVQASGEGRSEDEGMSGRALSGSGEVNLPQAPEDAPRFHGVMVEQKAKNTFEVKVNCRCGKLGRHRVWVNV
jgi:hypothetical protein